MFTPKTEKLKLLAEKYFFRIDELEKIFDNTTNIYIDFGNVKYWQEKLGWHISLKRLKQFLNSFDMIKETKFYYGTLGTDPNSAAIIAEARANQYIVITKPVKILKLSIDVSSISTSSPDILKNFISPKLLQKLNIETIGFLNTKLKEINLQGIKYLEDQKCNFDVEIGRDMLIDYHEKKAENFILWSGDSDFEDPIRQLLADGKRVALFVTSRKVARELNDLTRSGLLIYDIQKIRDFICWNREVDGKYAVKSKKDSIS